MKLVKSYPHCALALVVVGLAGGAPASAWGYDFMKNKGPVPSIGGGEGNVSSADIDPLERLGDEIPTNLAFVDGQGQRLTLQSVLDKGRPVLLTLGYYNCPMLCNLVHEGLSKAIKEAGLVPGREFTGLAVSIDPNEKAELALRNEGRLQRALGVSDRSNWLFALDASGPGAPMAAALAKAVGFRFKYDEASKQFAHAAVAVVLTPTGKISRYLYGVDFKARDVRLAIVEASGGRVGTTLDRVLLACFKYDPLVQRYTPYVLGFVRIGAFLSFAALVGLLVVLWRREVLLRNRPSKRPA